MLDNLAQFTEGIEFAEWLAQENFIKVEGVHCNHCGAVTVLQGTEEFCVIHFYGKIILTNNARI